jgi:hypothetical protein
VNPLAIFRDTTNPENMTIDSSYSGVLAYANGRYAWPTSQINRYVEFGKHLYRIDVTGAIPHGASILDVERYDATPQTAEAWVPERNAFEGDAACYVDRSNVPELVECLGDNKCWLIVADWTGKPHLPTLKLPSNIVIAGCQYATNVNYDTTAIYSADWLAGRHIP